METFVERAWMFAVASDRDGNREIYVMAADGSGATRLTRAPESDYNPRWSPTGSEIVFYREVGEGIDQIFVVAVDTGEERAITDDGALNTFPAFRPDGRIGFSFWDAARSRAPVGDLCPASRWNRPRQDRELSAGPLARGKRAKENRRGNRTLRGAHPLGRSAPAAQTLPEPGSRAEGGRPNRLRKALEKVPGSS